MASITFRVRSARLLRAGAALALGAGFAGACTLPSDFDDLEGTPPPTLGGSSGSGECAKDADCGDGDPCTTDTCDKSGDAAKCTNESREGIFPDGLEETLEIETAHRATLAKNDFDTFYVSVFGDDGDGPRLGLYTAETTGDELTLAVDGSAITDGVPASALGMVASAGVPFRLYGYLGVDDQGTGRVDLVTFNDQLEVLSTEMISSDYQLEVPYRAPIAWAGGGSVYGAFIETLGKIGFHTVGGSVEQLTSLGVATQLAPLVNEKGDPGVLFTTLGTANVGGKVFAQAVGGTQVEVPLCDAPQNAEEAFFAASSLIAGIKGVNLTSITHIDQDSGFVTESNRTVVCSSSLPNGCVAATPDASECEESTAQGGRAIAQDAIQHPGSPAGVILHAFAMPQLIPDDSIAEQVRVDLTMIAQVLDLSNIDGADPTKPVLGQRTIGEPVVLSSLPLTDFAAGADLPELSLIDDRVLITWLERSEAGTDRVQVRRLAICEAPADSGN